MQWKFSGKNLVSPVTFKRNILETQISFHIYGIKNVYYPLTLQTDESQRHAHVLFSFEPF
jgi:hypothetical protein